MTIELCTENRHRSAAAEAEAEQTMNSLHAEYSGALLQFLLTLTKGERHTAEDLLQETMIRAWRNLDGLPEGYEARRRWLFVVARHIAIDAIRMRKARPSETNLVDLTQMPSHDITESVIARESLRDAIRSLTDGQRLILSEIYGRGHSIKETARLHGLPVGTVKSRVHYALRVLKESLAASI